MADILYISCHSVLEYDELRILTSLGHRIFSCGSYFNPEFPAEVIRPKLKLHQDPEWRNIFYKTGCGGTPLKLSKEFLSKFDYIIAMHGHEFILKNLKNISKKTKVIWRGIGQSNPIIELKLKILKSQGVYLIRYSPIESITDNFAGEDCLIRFGKKLSDFNTKNKRNNKTMLCYNSIQKRIGHNDWEQSKGFIYSIDTEIYGASNEGTSNWLGTPSYEEQLNLYGTYSRIFCLSSSPAPYTLGFIEAVLSGAEVFINKHGNRWDERFLFKQNYERVSGDIYKFNPDDKIKTLFSDKQIKAEWEKMLG